ncbi:TetR family transcriptional regulator [Tamaricihabitans halophyticus]|uniref:TetR family transcriptional regulator n=1 Tax=Tamaricihabitans halophyticus TaxID=1262583 RepID=A0A4R2QL90_9PSEU|nr:TetR/AcrR family transcriptional regulator [Tamaricihabitans halophyticus]TCP49298.1 TetR family transcriptional regulator [Tamaricihabitans halophyticus]
MPRPKTHDDALRGRLLDRAGELLSEQGPRALSLRKLATDVNTSTTAVYSLFGGKAQLVRELYVDAFRRFGRQLGAVARSGDAPADLVQLGLAYREQALANQNQYAIMFGKPVPEFEPDEQANQEAAAAITPLLDIVREGTRTGALAGPSPEAIALAYWALLHGLVALELSNVVPAQLNSKDSFEHALRAQLAGWRA